MIESKVREPIPSGLSVTMESTPVVYFGDYENASSCTIAINPSDREFRDENGNLLDGSRTRLCSRRQLGRKDNEPLSQNEAKIVIDYCRDYFNHNPYLRWFNMYDWFLQQFNLSYYDHTAVHLDLVQWPTTPIWRNLDRKQKELLIADGLPFVKNLLSNRNRKPFDYIFLNGKTVVTEVSKRLGIELYEEENRFDGNKKFTVYLSSYNGSRVIGWSSYLQSPPAGSYKNVEEIANTVKQILERHLR